MLQQFGIALGDLGTRESDDKGKQFYIIMKSAPGINLFEFLKANKDNLHPLHLLDLMKKMCQVVDDFHQRGYIHRDIKQENFLYHPGTGKVTLVDFGCSVQSPTDGKEFYGNLAGAMLMMPPEVYRERCYSKRSDTFSLGATLADILKLLDVFHTTGDEHCPHLYPQDDDHYTENLVIKDKDILNQVYQLCEKMMAVYRFDRITLSSAIHEFDNIQASLKNTPVRVGMINICKYEKLSKS